MKKYLLIFTFFVSLSAFAEVVTTNLVVWAKDGSRVVYALAEKPKVNFTETHLIIKTENVEVSYELTWMKQFTYEKTEDNSHLINVSIDKMNGLQFNGESLLFPASNSDSTVRIYSSDGKVILNKKVSKGQTLGVSLASFNSGMYLVKIDGITYKIVKR